MNDIQKAVMKKLESIFENTQHIRSVKIEINGSLEEATTIRYDIEEFICPDEWREDAIKHI